MKIPSALMAFLLLVIGLSLAVAAQTKPAPIRIVAANLNAELEKKAAAEPNIQPAALAKYANDLLAKKGFDFGFDLCEFLAQYNPTRRGARAGAHTYKLPMKQTNGLPITFETAVNDGDGGACGECFVSIPITRVTAKEIELIAGGKKYAVVRPRLFFLDEIDLVDQTMRKVLRTWHFDSGGPSSISSDGTKLYFEIYLESGETASILLEESETGSLRFVARNEVRLAKGEEIKKHPIDRHNAYLSFMRFRYGQKSLIVRYSEPCT